MRRHAHHSDLNATSRKPLPPPEAVLVLMVHQSFRMTNVGQPGGQQAVVSVDDGQTLVLQLNPQRSEAFFRLYSSFPSLLYLPVKHLLTDVYVRQDVGIC